jgi:hypothetical protein
MPAHSSAATNHRILIDGPGFYELKRITDVAELSEDQKDATFLGADTGYRNNVAMSADSVNAKSGKKELVVSSRSIHEAVGSKQFNDLLRAEKLRNRGIAELESRLPSTKFTSLEDFKKYLKIRGEVAPKLYEFYNRSYPGTFAAPCEMAHASATRELAT